MEIKELLKTKRLEMGLSMKELSEKVGVSEATISRWESGDIANMRRDKIAALSEVLGISPVTLLGIEEDKGYYLDDEAAEMANELKERPDLRAMFYASRKLTPEDVERFTAFLQGITNSDDL